MLGDTFAPLFPIALAAKDFEYATRSGEAAGAAIPLTQRASEVFRDAAQHDLGGQNITAIAKRYR